MKSKMFRFLTRQMIPNVGTILLMTLIFHVYQAQATPGVNLSSFTPKTIPYQGTLANGSGNAITGPTNATFRIYGVSSGGTALWTEARTGQNALEVTNGLFQLQLGNLTPFPRDLWNNDTLYLGVQVGGDPEMTPREPLGSVPYASSAGSSAKAVTRVGTAEATSSIASYVTVPEMDISFDLVESRQVVMLFSGGVTNLTATGGPIVFRLVVDGTPKAQVAPYIYHAGTSVPMIMHWGEVLPPGTHNVKVEWAVSSGTGRFLHHNYNPPWEQRVLSVMTFAP